MKKVVVITGIVLIVLVLASALTMYIVYNNQIGAVDKNDNKEIEVVIPEGATTKKIATILKEKELIKNENFFLLYVKINKVTNLKATTYMLKKSMPLEEIIEALQKGNNYSPDQITITFTEGINMRKIAKIIENNTNNSYDDVFNILSDKEYIDELIEKYWFLSDAIKSEDIYYPLEGYLFPNTYNFKNKDVSVKEIFEHMLNQMDRELKKLKDDIDKSNLTIHELLTLASVVEQEGGVKIENGVIIKDERPTVASVFYNRLKEKMSLGSDVTTYYAVKVDMSERDLYAYELKSANPYNTRGPNMEGKLPVGPISTVGLSAITAAIKPTETDYLYFVADKYKNTYFTRSYSEHQAKIKELKDKGDWYQYGG